MSGIDPTPLESFLLGAFHDIHGAKGFPSPSEVTVLSRENTGAGRYVNVATFEGPRISDGLYDLGGKYIEIAGVPNGLMAVARVAGGRLIEIELAVYGDDPWDGVERSWSIK